MMSKSRIGYNFAAEEKKTPINPILLSQAPTALKRYISCLQLVTITLVTLVFPTAYKN